eukprot:4031152-Amphidinium_carterae.1
MQQFTYPGTTAEVVPIGPCPEYKPGRSPNHTGHQPPLRTNLAGFVAAAANRASGGHHEYEGWEHLHFNTAAWLECLTQTPKRHARGTLLGGDDDDMMMMI